MENEMMPSLEIGLWIPVLRAESPIYNSPMAMS
jgi:hypothetical protein